LKSPGEENGGTRKKKKRNARGQLGRGVTKVTRQGGPERDHIRR